MYLRVEPSLLIFSPKKISQLFSKKIKTKLNSNKTAFMKYNNLKFNVKLCQLNTYVH